MPKTSYWANLIVTAGLQPDAERTAEDWDLVFRAGVYEISRQCDQYLDVLFRFNREQRAGRQDLAAAAAAAGAIMGLSGVSSKAIGIAAAAFGLASSWFEASVNSVLFTIEPSALRNVALQGRQKYLDDLKQKNVKINSRPDTLIALQGYLTQCSPAALEANINNAASGAPSVVSPVPGVAEKAAALAAPSSTILAPAAAGKSVEQRAEQAVGQTITTKPLPVPLTEQPLNLQPGDSRGLTKTQIRDFQAALGVKVDGDPGQAGSDTRKALQEFQIGMSKRPETSWPPTEINGTLGPRTVSRLSGMKAMPKKYFLSPFERAYLGNLFGDKTNAAFDVPDVDRLRGVSANLLDNLENNPELKGKVEESVLADYQQRANKNLTVDEQLKLMSDMIADIRKLLMLDPQRRDLDSILYDRVNPK
jgi:hypothetical protein